MFLPKIQSQCSQNRVDRHHLCAVVYQALYKSVWNYDFFPYNPEIAWFGFTTHEIGSEQAKPNYVQDCFS